MHDDLALLFRPTSVAVVGASANPGKIGHVALANLMSGDFTVYPVNPKETEILGLKCYPSLCDVPCHVDIALVVLPAQSSIKVVEEAVDKGIRYP
jgi:acyl-CoA synthetase (NDP forming)